MENLYYSGWPEQPNWVQYHNAALNEDTSSAALTPRCVLPPHDTTFQSHGFTSWSGSTEEGRSVSASKSHCQAEKRRRDRINGHLSTLRKLIPESDKMDKAGLLGSVVEQVKNLKRRATEIGKVFTVLPTEVDEVTVECSSDNQDIGISSTINTSKESLFIKASMCCDDRPELFSELNKALYGLKLTTVRAEMASIGGRNKSILVLCVKDDDHDGANVNKLKQSLKAVLSRIALSSAPSGFRISSKRQKFFLPSNFPQ